MIEKMELFGLIVVALLSFLNSVQSEDYGLTVTPEHVNVDVGAYPTFTCSVNKSAIFLLKHPIQWERHGRDGYKEVISVLANVDLALQAEYNVQHITTTNNNDGFSFSLTFRQGIKKKYDGFFKCVLYHNYMFILDEAQVEVHVNKDYGLTVTPEHVNVDVGAYPTFTCFVNKSAIFLLKHPIQWERHGRDGYKEVISVLANVDLALQAEYDVQHITTTNNNDGLSFSLTFRQGIKKKYDGFFKCVLYHNYMFILDEAQVEVHVNIQSEDYGLTVTPEHVNVDVGAYPTFTCSVNMSAIFLLKHPIQWERHRRDGYKEVISVLANVDLALQAEYEVQHITSTNNNDGFSFSLTFRQGIKKKYDGFFKCVLYHNYMFILDEAQVEVHVNIQSEDYGLTVTPEHVNVDVGAYPTFTCSVNMSAIFLLKHPIQWERHGRDGYKEVISVLANVDLALQAEYEVQHITSTNNNDGLSFSLTFRQGIKKKYDGFFKCVLYHNYMFILDEAQVEVHVNIQSEDIYGLTVTPEHVNVDVGAHPTFTCAIKKAANFLIEHPIKWERHGRDGSNEVISVLANVESVLDTEYHVKLITPANNNDGMSFLLTFPQGIENKYDGFFKCVLYHNDTFILTHKQVEVHVIKMFSKMEFRLDTHKQVNVGISPVHIRLEEGTYNSLCKTEGSNPAADIQIFLDDVEETGVIITLENKYRTEPPQAWNVENIITLTLTPTHNNKILKCVAMVNKETSMKKEMSYKLYVYSVVPEIKCGNFSAMSGDKFVDMVCSIELKGIKCTDAILWENGNNGEQYKVDTLDEEYKIFCENVDSNTVKTTLRISSIKSSDFKTDFFVFYVNKHGSTTRHVTTLHQEYSSASSIQYGIYLMCSTIVAVALLL